MLIEKFSFRVWQVMCVWVEEDRNYLANLGTPCKPRDHVVLEVAAALKRQLR